jgi:outer membrane lipoprotein-sorting protein
VRRLFGGIVAAILLAGLGRAAPPEPKVEETLRQLGRASAEVESLRAEFVQEKHVTIVRDVLRSAGTFALDKRASRIVWNVTEPEPIRIVISKQGLFAGGKRVVGDEAGRFSPLPMLQGMTDLFSGVSPETARRFEVTLLDGDRLRLKPRARELAQWIQAIEIVLDAKTKTPRHIRLEEPGGDTTEISFRGVVLNPKLDDAAFAP